MLQCLFYLWIFCFLFYRYSVVGSLSIDNLLVPILVLGWFFTSAQNDPLARAKRTKIIFTILLALLVFIFVITVKMINEPSLFLSMLFSYVKQFLYVLLPVLYIRDLKQLLMVNSFLTITVCVNYFAAMLGAFHIVPYFAHSELGYTRIPGLQRSRGFFENLGDSAMLTSYSFLSLVAHDAKSYFFGRGRRKIKIIVILFLLGGMLANQSRNIILTSMIALFAYPFSRKMLKSYRPKGKIIVLFAGGVIACIFVSFLIMNFGVLFDTVSHSMGKSGQGTVDARISSYAYAFSLLENNLWLGLDSKDIIKYGNFISGMHNMWLGTAMKDGLLGVLAILTLCISALRGAMKASEASSLFPQGVIFFTFILSSIMFSSSFYPAHTAFVFWFFLGLSLSVGSVSIRSAIEEKVSGP